MHKAPDSIQQHLAEYEFGLKFSDLSPEAVHAAKARVIDTLGALSGGFFGEPCHMARKLAAQTPHHDGATIVGTRMKTTPDLAAFANATTAHYAELMDVYHSPGSFGGHPSDTVLPVLSVAEHAHVSGRQFITGVVLAYEVYCRISDVVRHRGFDHTNFACLGSAVGAGKMLGLSVEQLAHGIAMAVVPNNTLRQARRNQKSMFKAVASGQAGRAGVFAALLARAGMHGPHLPFEGKAGWCDHVAGARFSLGAMGGNGIPFKILDTRIKNRPAAGIAIAPILAAEKLAPLDIKAVKQITIEVHKIAKDRTGSGEHAWNPRSREDADHSAPYLVAVTLMHGTVTMDSFNDAHLGNPSLRVLMRKTEVVENESFTKAYMKVPQAHCARVTVLTNNGELLAAAAGDDTEDLAAERSVAQIEEKFGGFTQRLLGTKRANTILKSLWDLENVADVATIPEAFAV